MANTHTVTKKTSFGVLMRIRIDMKRKKLPELKKSLYIASWPQAVIKHVLALSESFSSYVKRLIEADMQTHAVAESPKEKGTNDR